MKVTVLTEEPLKRLIKTKLLKRKRKENEEEVLNSIDEIECWKMFDDKLKFHMGLKQLYDMFYL